MKYFTPKHSFGINYTILMKTFLLSLFLLFVGLPALITVINYYDLVWVPGPNTVGEAGKVFFANRFMEGSLIFMAGDVPPYYPSLHGGLFHAVVGVVGLAIDAEIHTLYFIGRVISVICTVTALMLVINFLQYQNAGWFWSIALIMFFFCVQPVTQHTISYRPDNWVMFLSVLSAYILISRPENYWSLILLAMLPVVAFFLKATGLYISLAVFIDLFVRQGKKISFFYALLTFIFFLVSVFIVNAFTEAQFVQGLIDGASVEYSFVLAYNIVALPQMWIPIIISFLLMPKIMKADNIKKKQVRTFAIFFVISFIVSVLTSLRVGSNTYYYLDPFVFGLSISTVWLAYFFHSFSKRDYDAKILVSALILIISLFGFHSNEFRQILLGEKRVDISVQQTQRFVGERQKLAEHINQNNLSCYSDDPGLNVLLDKPNIIYPIMQTMYIHSGFLDISSLLDPVIKQEYDIIALTGTTWRYYKYESIPREFFVVLEEFYAPVETDFSYRIFVSDNNLDIKFNARDY